MIVPKLSHKPLRIEDCNPHPDSDFVRNKVRVMMAIIAKAQHRKAQQILLLEAMWQSFDYEARRKTVWQSSRCKNMRVEVEVLLLIDLYFKNFLLASFTPTPPRFRYVGGKLYLFLHSSSSCLDHLHCWELHELRSVTMNCSHKKICSKTVLVWLTTSYLVYLEIKSPRSTSFMITDRTSSTRGPF